MKQILQHLKTGRLELAEVPCPRAGRGQVLVQTRATLISAGTERMLVEFGKANLISKARQQPDKVKQVLDKIKTDGFLPTLETVRNKLDQPLPLGYCNAGTVLEVGTGIDDIRPGDRVVSNGCHAELVCVPRNLCAKIPESITFEQATFTVVGSIALQGIRLAAPTLGEKFMVFGMGLIGLLTVQLLKANGCEVIAVDVNPNRLQLAEKFGALTVNAGSGEEPTAAANLMTNGNGVDAVLITASAKNDNIVHQAAQACRKRGRIILVGVVDLNLRRCDFYEKELTFQVSCSYGPGRYDEKYEQQGQDYPYGFVRWTQQRNFEAVLNAINSSRLRVDELITDRFTLEDAELAYQKIQEDKQTLGVILQYPESVNKSPVINIMHNEFAGAGSAVVGVIGAGNFSKGVLLPALAKTQAKIEYIADLDSAAVHQAAKKFKAAHATTDYKKILEDENVKAVFVVVGHHLHSRFVCEALEAGKHVYTEKPLALNEIQLQQVQSSIVNNQSKMLMVGFNRRFSPHIIKVKELLGGRKGPLCMNMTVNAGEIPKDSWIQNPDRGGGRIIGEGCHFIDLLSHLADSPVETVSASMVDGEVVCSDKMSIVLKFNDGSIGTINYFANGPKSYPKERIEIFSDGRVLTVENFRVTRGYGFGSFKKLKTLRQDKGHRHEIAAFVNLLINGGKTLIPLEQLINVTKASFAAMESSAKGKTINILQQEQPSGTEWPLSNLFYNSHQQFATCEESKSQDKFENV